MRPPQAVIPPKMSAGLATRYLSALSPQTGHFHPRALMPCPCIAACISPPPSSVLAPWSSILSSCQNFSSPLMHPPPGFSSPFILALAPVLTQVNHFIVHVTKMHLTYNSSRPGPRKESASRSLTGRPSVRETQLLLLRKTQGLPEGENVIRKPVRKTVPVTKLWTVHSCSGRAARDSPGATRLRHNH